MIGNATKRWAGRLQSRSAAVLVMAVLAACEGVGIPATDNPYTKLSQADYLRSETGRIMQARRLVDQAIEIFEQQKDKAGLAQAYRQYGLIALVGGANPDPVILLRDPKAPRRPTTDELDLSDGYLKRAAELARETKQLYLVANLNFVLGNNQVRRGTPDRSCPYYDLAAQGFHEAETQQPTVKPYLPAGVNNPFEFLNRAKKEAGCPAT